MLLTTHRYCWMIRKLVVYPLSRSSVFAAGRSGICSMLAFRNIRSTNQGCFYGGNPHRIMVYWNLASFGELVTAHDFLPAVPETKLASDWHCHMRECQWWLSSREVTNIYLLDDTFHFNATSFHQALRTLLHKTRWCHHHHRRHIIRPAIIFTWRTVG